jgi:ATP-dependent Zn protease
VTAEPTTRETPLWLTVLVYVGPTLLLFGLWYWYLRRTGAAGDGMFGFGRAKVKQYEATTERMTFAERRRHRRGRAGAGRGGRLPPRSGEVHEARCAHP